MEHVTSLGAEHEHGNTPEHATAVEQEIRKGQVEREHTEIQVTDAQRRRSRRRSSDASVQPVPFAGISAMDDRSQRQSPAPQLTRHDAQTLAEVQGTTRGSGIADALRRSGRNRKGSLRQRLLGMNMLQVRRGPHENQQSTTEPYTIDTNMPETTPDDDTTPRPRTYNTPLRNPSSESGWPPAPGPSKSDSASSFRTSSYELVDQPAPAMLPETIAISSAPSTSTTDDDDEAASPYTPSGSSIAASYSTSSFQATSAAMSLLRRRPNRLTQHTSLSTALGTVQSPTDLALEDEWDYSETEWWGWIILIATWTVFVVGMGSCLGVWSWAWDVGETPYAPPELEDDPTLPITGYYPALMVCTAVMAWVWVVVAWVGMKYFRHAKMVGEDG